MVKDFFEDTPSVAEKAFMQTLGKINRMAYGVPVDLEDRQKEYVLTVNVAGFKKENINIDFEDGILTIEGKNIITNDNNPDTTTENPRYILKERVTSQFSRKFSFVDIKDNEISAKLEDGVLVVTIPKKDIIPPSKIEIN